MMIQNKDIIEKILCKHFFKFQIRVHLELLKKCKKDKTILFKIIKKYQRIDDRHNLYIIGVYNDWEYIEIIMKINNNYILSTISYPLSLQYIKTEYYSILRKKLINIIINEKEI